MSEIITKEMLDSVYAERNKCVALLVRMALQQGLTAGIRTHQGDEPGWDPEWLNVACIDLPSGQVTWHLHQSEMPLFEGVPAYTNDWDGHDTEEKYRRVVHPGF